MMSKFLIAGAAIAFAVALVATSVVDAANACGVVALPNGSKVDLSGFSGTFVGSLTQVGVGGGSFTWGISPCDASVTPPGGTPCAGGSFLTQAACTVTFPSMKGAVVGNADAIVTQYVSTSANLNWLATLNLICGTNDGIAVQGNQYDASQPTEQSVNIVFFLSSKSFCVGGGGNGGGGSGGDAGGLTWGGVFLIIFFVPLGIYFIGMVAWNYHKGMAGTDLLPHREFWGSLPGLFKDGLTFTWAKIRGQEWSSSESGVGSGAGTSGASTGATSSGYTTV